MNVDDGNVRDVINNQACSRIVDHGEVPSHRLSCYGDLASCLVRERLSASADNQIDGQAIPQSPVRTYDQELDAQLHVLPPTVSIPLNITDIYLYSSCSELVRPRIAV